MEGFKFYRRKGGAWLRPHIVGEDLAGISVAKEDVLNILDAGGWVAINKDNPADQWYVNAEWFDKNYEAEPTE